MQTVSLVLPILLILGIPLGAGGQNTLMSMTGAWLIWRTYCAWETLDFESLKKDRLIVPIILLTVFFVWMSISAFSNPINPQAMLIAYLAGYAPLVLLPPLFYLNFHRLGPREWQILYRIFVAITIIMALIALTQELYGWQREGFWITDSEHRARAFYSHPLSLAYVSLLVFPAAVAWFFQNPRSLVNALFFVAVIVLVWTSRSRVVQLVSLLIVAVNIFYLLKPKLRVLALMIMAVAVGIIAITNNPVSRNFRETLAGQADRHALQYPDDRIAFWHAYWVLFKQRPIIGHGPHFPKSSREAAYKQIGLESFKKKYNAHNVYLQIAVEGGVIGLLIFIAWFATIFRRFVYIAKDHLSGFILALTWAAFGIAIVTQNAFQDNEVRYCLTLLLACGFVAIRKSREPEPLM